jgi:hypothetical protein
MSLKSTGVGYDHEETDRQGRSVSMSDKLRWTQLITRRWMGLLNIHEFLVVQYIFDRTIMWGNVERRITIKEFEAGNKLNAGLPMCRRRIITALGALVDKGALVARRSRYSGNVYSLNLEWAGGAPDSLEEDPEDGA